jgi:uncharacterized protein YraI
MRRRALLLLAPLLAVSTLLQAQDQGATAARRAFTVADVNLREAPSADARVIVILPRTTLVGVGDCDDTWCGVEFRGIEGFVARRYLAFSRPVADDDTAVKQQSSPQRTDRGYINSRGQWVPSPQRSPDGKPPAAATAQCHDGTYSFSRSRSGTCSWHGGVAKWL